MGWLIFPKKLAANADLYVNDAFGTAHRAHASTEGVTHYLSPSVAGYLIEKELNYLQSAIETPQRPLAAIIGGSKVSSKIGVIETLLEKCDKLLIGGGMIFTFYKARGLSVGKSLVEEDKLELAKSLEAKAKEKGVELEPEERNFQTIMDEPEPDFRDLAGAALHNTGIVSNEMIRNAQGAHVQAPGPALIEAARDEIVYELTFDLPDAGLKGTDAENMSDMGDSRQDDASAVVMGAVNKADGWHLNKIFRNCPLTGLTKCDVWVSGILTWFLDHFWA